MLGLAFASIDQNSEQLKKILLKGNAKTPLLSTEIYFNPAPLLGFTVTHSCAGVQAALLRCI